MDPNGGIIFHPLAFTNAAPKSKPSVETIKESSSASKINNDSELNYKIWKKNAPLLYDSLQTSTMLWPSLTLDWFPDTECINSGNIERILLGSYSSQFNSFESLEICSMRFETEHLTLEDCEFDPDRNEFMASHISTTNNEGKVKGGLQLIQELPHVGDINRARIMPQNPDLIATISNIGMVCIFDRTKKPNSFDQDELMKSGGSTADIKLKFHSSEGWGLCWNSLKEGELVSGSNDGSIAVWDIKRGFKILQNGTNSLRSPKRSNVCRIKPRETTYCHDLGVNCVKYSDFNDSLVGTAGEDGLYKLFDTRDLSKGSVLKVKLPNALNALDFNKKNEFCIALGDVKGNLVVEDIRKPNKPALTINNAHNESITTVAWNNQYGNIIATSSDDAKVKLWKIGSTKDPLFVHAGHMLGVNDIQWNPSDPKMMASCSQDNSVQIWKPSSSIF